MQDLVRRLQARSKVIQRYSSSLIRKERLKERDIPENNEDELTESTDLPYPQEIEGFHKATEPRPTDNRTCATYASWEERGEAVECPGDQWSDHKEKVKD